VTTSVQHDLITWSSSDCRYLVSKSEISSSWYPCTI